jgi:hypothetical protein
VLFPMIYLTGQLYMATSTAGANMGLGSRFILLLSQKLESNWDAKVGLRTGCLDSQSSKIIACGVIIKVLYGYDMFGQRFG